MRRSSPIARPWASRSRAAALVLLLSCGLLAAPRAIRDDRLIWVSGVPNLGRGYSIRNNKLQSMCFEKVAKNKPTFDFDYQITEVTAGNYSTLGGGALDRVRSALLGSFLRDHLGHPPLDDGSTWRTLLVQLVVQTYQRSLDEPGSVLHKSALQLLEDQRYESFFSACGFFYIRSVRTFSTYAAILQFRAGEDDKRDVHFLDKLQQGLLSLNEGPAAKKLEADEEVRDRGLRVFVRATGLAKGGQLNLVPISIPEFRETIKNAATLMQDPETGMVSQIEVAPWLDHPTVADLVHQNLDGPKGAPKGPHDLTSFERLHNLEINEQVITSIQEYRDFLMSRLHLANLCKEILLQHYPVREGDNKGSGRFFDPAQTFFVNQAREGDESLQITLSEFIDQIKDEPDEILGRIRRFMYGPAATWDQKSGAAACMNELSVQLDTGYFGKIPACVEALRVDQANYVFLDEYCLPKPSGRVAVRLPKWLQHPQQGK